MGVIVGSGIGGVGFLKTSIRSFLKDTIGSVHFYTHDDCKYGSGQIAIQYGAKGINDVSLQLAQQELIP